MAESELEILLRLRDEASEGLRQANEALKKMQNTEGGTERATRTLSDSYTGMGRAIRMAVPTVQEFSGIIDGSIKPMQAFSTELNRAGMGMDYMIIQMRQQLGIGGTIAAMAGLNLGLGMLQAGISMLVQRSQEATLHEENWDKLTKILTADNYNLTDSTRQQTNALIQQTEATGNLTKAQQYQVGLAQQAMAAAQFKSDVLGLENSLGLLNDSEIQNYEITLMVNAMAEKWGWTAQQAADLVDNLTTAVNANKTAQQEQALATKDAAEAMALQMMVASVLVDQMNNAATAAQREGQALADMIYKNHSIGGLFGGGEPTDYYGQARGANPYFLAGINTYVNPNTGEFVQPLGGGAWSVSNNINVMLDGEKVGAAVANNLGKSMSDRSTMGG